MRCEQGYLCDVCGMEVESLTESDLYLRYVLGEVQPRELFASPERHLRCNPTVAQFIVAAEFPAVEVAGPFDKRTMDQADRQPLEERYTRGWRRLQEIPTLGLSILEYPLPEARS